ncbi:MAG TPA: hypothetical protein VMM93_13230 [Vicinamibacterales bacterium]|nr:hypothetical protein [Vicinamibacterales bacterium]
MEFSADGPPAGYSLVEMAPGATPGTGVGRAATLPCDCSCEAYAEYRKLEAEAKRGNKEAEAELKKRMACVMQCVMQWAACGRR